MLQARTGTRRSYSFYYGINKEKRQVCRVSVLTCNTLVIKKFYAEPGVIIPIIFKHELHIISHPYLIFSLFYLISIELELLNMALVSQKMYKIYSKLVSTFLIR